jgi:tetratricopeptide (TPR) repeat protein
MAISNKAVSAIIVAACFSFLQTSMVECKSSPWDGFMATGKQNLETGNYMDARTALEQALTATRTFKEGDPRLGTTYHALGNLYLKEQDYEQAKQYFERALALEQKALGPESLEVADALYGLALSAQQGGDPMAAEIYCKRSAEIWSKVLGPTNPKLLNVLPDMALYANLSGDYRRGNEYYRKLVSLQEKVSGSNSPQVASQLNLLAQGLANLGDYGEAERYAQRAVDILRNAPGQSIALDSAKYNLRYIKQQMNGGKPIPDDEPEYQPPPPVTPPLETRPVPETRVPTKSPEITTKPVETKPVQVATKPVETKPVEVMTKPVETKPVTKPVETKPVEVATKPVETKPVEVASNPPETKPVEIATASTDTKKVVRVPSTAVSTSSQDFHPWELKNQTSSDNRPDRTTSYGKIKYLSGGRLISQEEYKAMLLANSAYEMIRAEKYLMAVDILKKALNTCNTLASAHTNLGLALSRLGQNEDAISHLKESIALDPKRSAAWLNLASCFQINGQLRESVATYSEYLNRFPQDSLAAKARDLVAHLTEEVNKQNAVEKALASKPSGNDYFSYATLEKTIRWTQTSAPIKVYISSSGGANFKPEYPGLMRDAFKQWSTASNGKVAFDFVTKSDGADIDCVWTNDPSKVSSPSEGGETRISSSGKGIDHATVTVLTADPSPDSPLSQNQLKAVCLHEIGHALGLLGHSPKPQDVMYCSIPPADAKVALSPRDVSTLQRLYSSDVIVGHAKFKSALACNHKH